MNKSKILLLASLILFVNIGDVNAATMESITKALQKYCVPKPGDVAYGFSVCSSVFEGIYIPQTQCQCYDQENLVYDSVKRYCVPKCKAGFIAKEVSKCNTGEYKYTMKRGDSVAYMCKYCSANTWSNGTFTSCKNCLSEGVASCESKYGKATSCKAGYGLNTNAGTCTICPIGYFSAGGTNTCQPCPVGKYSSEQGSSSCSACNSVAYGSWKVKNVQSDGTSGILNIPNTRSDGWDPTGIKSSGIISNGKLFTFSNTSANNVATCGPATRTKTTYCTKAGSTSPTANASSVSESGNAGTCGAGKTCTSGSCTTCSDGYYKASSGNGACTKCNDSTENCSTSCSCCGSSFSQSGTRTVYYSVNSAHTSCTRSSTGSCSASCPSCGSCGPSSTPSSGGSSSGGSDFSPHVGDFITPGGGIGNIFTGPYAAPITLP